MSPTWPKSIGKFKVKCCNADCDYLDLDKGPAWRTTEAICANPATKCVHCDKMFLSNKEQKELATYKKQGGQVAEFRPRSGSRGPGNKPPWQKSNQGSRNHTPGPSNRVGKGKGKGEIDWKSLEKKMADMELNEQEKAVMDKVMSRMNQEKVVPEITVTNLKSAELEKKIRAHQQKVARAEDRQEKAVAALITCQEEVEKLKKEGSELDAQLEEAKQKEFEFVQNRLGHKDEIDEVNRQKSKYRKEGVEMLLKENPLFKAFMEEQKKAQHEFEES